MSVMGARGGGCRGCGGTRVGWTCVVMVEAKRVWASGGKCSVVCKSGEI